MTIPYRTRQALRRFGVVILVLALAAVLVWLCWVVWLERYIVYNSDGARLDFSISADDAAAQPAKPPETEMSVTIYYNEGNNTVNTSTDLAQMAGYYIDSSRLTGDLNQLRRDIEALPSGVAIMIDVKSIRGTFYYTSTSSEAVMSTLVDVQAVDSLIADLLQSSHYCIARIPAFRDREFGLNHVDSGLPMPGGYLWMDDAGCYWLRPEAPKTMEHLIQITTELRLMGFDEVVYNEFRFPDAKGIVYNEDRSEVLATAAKNLVSACATDKFAVSFMSSNPGFPLPEGRSRLYLENVSAAEVADIAEQTGIEKKDVNLVFFATTNDTRFEDYSVLRPMP